jgi:hypothetical protein
MGMQAISPAEVNAFRAKLLKKKAGTMTKPGNEQKRRLSNKTVRNVLMLLGNIFDNAVKVAVESLGALPYLATLLWPRLNHRSVFRFVDNFGYWLGAMIWECRWHQCCWGQFQSS